MHYIKHYYSERLIKMWVSKQGDWGMECELLMRLHRTARYEYTRAGFLTSFPNSLRTVFLPFWVLVFMHTLTGSRAQFKNLGLFKQKKCENLFAFFGSAHTMVRFAQQLHQKPSICPPKSQLKQVCWDVPKSKDEMLFLKAFRGLKFCQQRHRTRKMSQRGGHTNKTELKSKVMQQFGQHETQ